MNEIKKDKIDKIDKINICIDEIKNKLRMYGMSALIYHPKEGIFSFIKNHEANLMIQEYVLLEREVEMERKKRQIEHNLNIDLIEKPVPSQNTTFYT